MGYGNKYAFLFTKCENCCQEFKYERWQKKRKFCSMKCNALKQAVIWENIPKDKQQQLLKERLEKRLIKTNDCWGWTGPKDTNNYGSFRIGNKTFRASRVSWMIYRGPIYDGLCVLHKCDNPICVNPEHLFLGTMKDNSQDMIKKNRQGGQFSKGNIPPISKLNPQKVKLIRHMINSNISLKEIANIFNVHKDTIYAVKTGKNWSHVK